MANYDFAAEVPLPAAVGVRRDGSIGAIMDSVAAVNYYTDVIGFGTKTGINRRDMQPLGVRYFMTTGMTCSNGEAAHLYVDSTPKGDLLGRRVKKALEQSGLPNLRGLAPGIMEDARDALNPLPLLSAAYSSGVPLCEQVDLPVGDLNGNIRSPEEPDTVWVPDPDVRWDGASGTWRLRRWVQTRDAHGAPQWAEPGEGFEDVSARRRARTLRVLTVAATAVGAVALAVLFGGHQGSP